MTENETKQLESIIDRIRAAIGEWQGEEMDLLTALAEEADNWIMRLEELAAEGD